MMEVFTRQTSDLKQERRNTHAFKEVYGRVAAAPALEWL